MDSALVGYGCITPAKAPKPILFCIATDTSLMAVVRSSMSFIYLGIVPRAVQVREVGCTGKQGGEQGVDGAGERGYGGCVNVATSLVLLHHRSTGIPCWSCYITSRLEFDPWAIVQ